MGCLVLFGPHYSDEHPSVILGQVQFDLFCGFLFYFEILLSSCDR